MPLLDGERFKTLRIYTKPERGSSFGKAAWISAWVFRGVALGLGLGSGLGCGSSVTEPAPVTPIPGPNSRDPLTWPFASNSIWNHPIGSEAVYVEAGFAPAANMGVDEDRWIMTTPAHPVIKVPDPHAWTERWDSTAWSSTTYFPAALLAPDASPPNLPNHASAVLPPGSRTTQHYEATARSSAAIPLFGYQAPSVDISSDGTCGGQFGSGLSRLGGTSRVGELRPPAGALHHALNLEAWAQRYYSSSRPGYRWPQDRAVDYPASRDHGTSPALTEESLLAISPSVNLSSPGFETDAARKIAQAIQDYGG